MTIFVTLKKICYCLQFGMTSPFYIAYTLWNADFVRRLVMVKLLTFFIFICFYLKKFLIVCCINLITLNQNIVINTKPNQYSFHSSIDLDLDNQSNSQTPGSSRFCKFQSQITHVPCSKSSHVLCATRKIFQFNFL